MADQDRDLIPDPTSLPAVIDEELAALVRTVRDPENLGALVAPRQRPLAERFSTPERVDAEFARYVGQKPRPVTMSVPPPRRRRHRERHTPMLAVFIGLLIVILTLVTVSLLLLSAPRYVKDALDTLPSINLFPSPRPAVSPTPRPTPEPSAAPSPTPEPTSTPAPVRAKTDHKLPVAPKSVFVSEAKADMCASAAIQMTVNILTGEPDQTKAFQRKIDARDKEFTTKADSKNGGWGATGMAKAISAYSGVTYEVRIAKSRAAALRDAARAIEATGQPVVLLVWRGAHAWVMTGFRSDADPLLFDDAKVSGAYILDPWYPRTSSIWGKSDAPGAFQDTAEMKRNYLAWKRPEGKYPDKDGKFVYLVPASAP